MESEDDTPDTDTVHSQDVKEESLGENVDILLNSSNCEQVNPEDEEEVNKIIKEEIPDLEFKCRCCKFVANSFEDIEKHENGHRARGTFLECEYCDFCTNTRDIMIQHVTKHTGERPFKCKKCSFRSRWKRDLIKHQVKHSDEKKFMCSQCDFTTKWYNNIKHHQIKHSNERPFTCHICDMKFKRKTGLDYHLYRHNDYKPKKCSKCDFRCKTNFELKLHQHKHSNVRNFPCTFPGCTQRCKTKSDLSKHVKIHSNVRDKICDICDKGFATFANLSKHKLRHVTERKFQCELCTRRFKTRISLRNHLTTHNDHKPFACDVCGHTFRNRHNMKTHKLTHSEDRAFKCPICPYAGKFPFHIFAHIGTFHGDKYAYFCEICRKPFRRYSQLQTHCGRMHKDSNLLTAVPQIKQEVVDEEEKTESLEATDNQISKIDESKVPTDIVVNQNDRQASGDESAEPRATDTNKQDDTVTSPETKADVVNDNDVYLLTPKSEDPNVLIYNIGPFRLPLATKGFDFNFEKTGKKPKQWFMDPQNMTDRNAAEKQRAYIEKKARGVDKSRGATLRKFGWKKAPYKPCLEENPRYKQERERQKRAKEAGRILVKQDPDLMELINVGRNNIRKIKICKRAGLLMKNWKVLEVKLEKIDAIDQKECRSETIEQADSTESQKVESTMSAAPQIPSVSSATKTQASESPSKNKRGRKPKKRKFTIKDMTENLTDSLVNKTIDADDIQVTSSEAISDFKLKSLESKKSKRPVGRPRKHPKKIVPPMSKKIKSAEDLIPPLPELDSSCSSMVPPFGLNISAEPSSVVLTEGTVEVEETKTTDAGAQDNSSKENIIDTDKKPTSSNNPEDHQDETSDDVKKTVSEDADDVEILTNKQSKEELSGSKEYSRTILSVPKIARRIPTEISSPDAASTSSSSTKKLTQKRSGRLNQTIDKLLAKKTSDMKGTKKVQKLWQPFISSEEASTSESGAQTTDGKRNRKSDAPRKIQKKQRCTRYLDLPAEYSDEDDLPLSVISGKQPQQMSYEDFITELQTRNESTQSSSKKKVGRPRKTDGQNSPKKILENLLCQPFRTKRNLTDLDVLRCMNESTTLSSKTPERKVAVTGVNAHRSRSSATYSKMECVIEDSVLHQRHPITLPSLYDKLTLIDALTMPNELDLDLSFKTTDLVGPEPDRTLGLPDITSLHDKGDLLRIQKCLRHEKYRLKKLDPESVAIKHIAKMINSGKASKAEKGSTSDCPILKKVLLRTKEADDNPGDDDVIITDVKDMPLKPIKLVIKKQKMEDIGISTQTSKRSSNSKSNKSEEKIRKGKKSLLKVQTATKVIPKAPQDSNTQTKKDPSSSNISKEVNRIKRKYTKRSAVWEVQNPTEQSMFPSKKLKIQKNKSKPPDCQQITKPRSRSVGKKCLASSDIKQVLQKYITKKRQLSLKTKKEKKKKAPKIKIKKTPKVFTKVKTKNKLKDKMEKELKSKVVKNKAKTKKIGKGLKVKTPRKSKGVGRGPEIYVDIEEEDEEYMTNSLQEKIITFPESMETHFPKSEPIDEDSYSGEQETGFDQVCLKSDCLEDPQNWHQEQDTKLEIQTGHCEAASDTGNSLDISSTGDPDHSSNINCTQDPIQTIKIEEDESLNIPHIKQEKPDYCDFSAQYEDISDFESDIPVKDEPPVHTENHHILNMVHVKYL